MAFDETEVLATLDLATQALWAIRAQAISSFKAKFVSIKERANLGDYGPEITEVGRTGLVALGNTYRAEIRRQFDPILKNWMRLAGYPGGDVRDNWWIIYRYCAEKGTPLTFKPRTPTYDTSVNNTAGRGSAGAIVGNSDFYRLTVDARGYPLGAGWAPATFYARCALDEDFGAARFEEVFHWHSDTTLVFFDRGPVGEAFDYTLVNDGGFISDGDFKIGNAANASPTALGKWKDDSVISSTAYELVTTPVYRSSRRELADGQVALALKWKANRTLYQEIDADLDRDKPYLPVIRVYKPAGCDKRIRVILGKTTLISQQIDALSGDDQYHVLVPTRDSALWPDNFKPIDASKLKLQIIVDAGSGSGVIFPFTDNVDLLEGRELNGTFIWQVSKTLPHVRDDRFDIADTANGDPGKILTLLQEGYGVAAPAAGSPAHADPA